MILVSIRCRGVSPLLQNRMSESVLEQLRTKQKKPKAANVGTTMTPREEAATKFYFHGDKPILPAECLMSCFIAAGVFVRLDGKRQISTGKATMLPGLMTLLSSIIYLEEPDSKKPAKWEPDVRKGTNPNGGEAVAICRPRFDAWAFSFDIEIDDHEIGENTIRELIDKAGKRIGLGDFRPSRKGVFGRFVVEKWDRVASDLAAE